MGRDLVYEVCVMVPQGLPTPLSRPWEGRVGGWPVGQFVMF